MSDNRAVVWIFDQGSEGHFPASLYSLKKNCRSFWENCKKIVVDCGVSQPFREWVYSPELDLAIIRPQLPRGEEVLGGGSDRAAKVMRLRIELSRVLDTAASRGEIPVLTEFMQCDPDTLFFRDPSGAFNLPWEGEDIRCVHEWDWHGPLEDNRQRLMPMFRPSTFISGNFLSNRAAIARALKVEESEITCITTVNSGVWVARMGGALSGKWLASYQWLVTAETSFPGGMFSPYAAEQNALSLGIYKGLILPRYLPRQYNYLPPRDPFDWPADVCIAHFVSFSRNWPRATYRIWSRMRASAIEAGFVPASLANPNFLGP